jgi:tetratricopeptide (TPR) repeat protein
MRTKGLVAAEFMIKRYAFLFMLFILACTMSIAKEKGKKTLPTNLPGMQSAEDEYSLTEAVPAIDKYDDSKMKLEEILFTPEELREINKEIQPTMMEPTGVQSIEPLPEHIKKAETPPPPKPVTAPQETPLAETKHNTAADQAALQEVPLTATEHKTAADQPAFVAPAVKKAEKPKQAPPVKKYAAQARAIVKKIPIPTVTVKPTAAEQAAVLPQKPAIIDDDTHFQKGVALYAQRDLRNAIKEFERVLDANGDDAESYYMLADIHYQLFDMENAWKNIRMAVELNGGKRTPLYRAIQQEIAKPFTVSLNTLLMIITGLCVIFMAFQGVMLRRKTATAIPHEEIELLKKEIEILKMKNDIQDPRVRYYKALEACQNGDTMLALNNSKSAEEEYRTAMTLYPQIINAYLGMGYIHFVQKKFDSAIQDYARAIDIDPHSAIAYYGLGRAVGEKGDAKAQLEKIKMAADLDPQFREANEALSFLQRMAA